MRVVGKQGGLSIWYTAAFLLFSQRCNPVCFCSCGDQRCQVSPLRSAGPLSTDCEACKHVQLLSTSACVATCPRNTYETPFGVCAPCHALCDGCLGMLPDDCTGCAGRGYESSWPLFVHKTVWHGPVYVCDRQARQAGISVFFLFCSSLRSTALLMRSRLGFLKSYIPTAARASA
jgi:hypothetical protein